MNKLKLTAVLSAAALLLAAHSNAQSEKGTGQAHAVITVLAKHNEVAPTISQQDVSAKADGKDATVAGWAPYKAPNDSLELMILIDSGARNLGRQFDEIKQFIQVQGPNTKVAIGYMQNGHVEMAVPFSADHKQVVSELHLPAGPTTNPYFTLSDLAPKWPSQDPRARREIVMLSDGIDPENQRFDPDDPYVQSAIKDCVRAGLVVYTIYWRSRPDIGGSSLSAEGGQSLLGELSQATGGNSYWTGTGNPVSFQPYFDDLMKRFSNQYALEVSAKLDRKPSVETLKLKVEGLGLQVTAPQLIFVHAAGPQ
jgi:hypothetical protein